MSRNKEKIKEPSYEKYENEILQNVKNIIKMFEPKDSIRIKYKTIKDKINLKEHIENYFIINGRKKLFKKNLTSIC